jgi:NADPH:quinone reductase
VDWTQQVLAATSGKGVDVLLESLGGEFFEQNWATLAPFGRYLIYGSTRGIGKPFEARRLMTKCQSITGLYVPFFYSQPDIVREALTFMVDHCQRGELRAKVDAQLPLAEAAKAQQMLEDRAVTGAIVLTPRSVRH